MEIKVLASLLIAGHLISIIFSILVIKRQWNLLKLPIHTTMREFRRRFFLSSLIILAANLIPVTIDVATFFLPLSRTQVVSSISVVYALSNVVMIALLPILTWDQYNLAAKSQRK